MAIFGRSARPFPAEITSVDDIEERFHAHRSFRRGSVSRATSQGVSQDDKYIVNRWKQREAGLGARPNFKIHQHYCDATQCLQNFLRYTRAMWWLNIPRRVPGDVLILRGGLPLQHVSHLRALIFRDLATSGEVFSEVFEFCWELSW